MTTQINDTCTINGRTWEIAEFCDLGACVPSSEELGFTTVTGSSMNWSGRIDHFVVHKKRLYLFKVEVTLPPDSVDFIPSAARKEVVSRIEPMTMAGAGKIQYWTTKKTYYLFDGLKIPYTGQMTLYYPVEDPWECPTLEDLDSFGEQTEAIAEFEDGVLVGMDEN